MMKSKTNVPLKKFIGIFDKLNFTVLFSMNKKIFPLKGQKSFGKAH